MRALIPSDYEKISDDVYFLGDAMMLKFHVILAKKSRYNDQRETFHHEYMYQGKYTDIDKVVTLKRDFDYYLSLDNVRDKLNVLIRAQDMILLNNSLKEISTWFTNGTIFGTRKKTLIVLCKPKPIIISGLALNNMIQFDPVVISYDGNPAQYQGVRITLLLYNGQSSFSDITVDKFFGLMYMLSTFNMYQAASTAVNYLGRPPLGTNLVEFSTIKDGISEVIEPDIKVKDRQIKNLKKSNKSKFDQLDDM